MAIATKPKPRQTIHHRKRVGEHQKRGRNFHNTYWPYLPLVAVVALGMFVNTLLGGGVLSYATNTSVDGLLASTNSQRASDGDGQLAINSQLMNAAQAKANDMATRNYWSHNTPDGQEPWVFVRDAGYKYQAVGENLAYGFTDSNATITGWLNSPSHRENMLNGTYTEVGFGIANSENYQTNGNQTIVVAMYGKPLGLPVATAPAPAPAPTAVSPSYTMTEQTVTTPGDEKPTENAPVETSGGDVAVSAVVPGNEEQQVARIEIANSGNVPSWSVFALSMLIVGAAIAFISRHSLAWHKVLVRGEKFILRHKVLDVVLVSGIMIAFILTRTVGVIQ